MNYHIMVNRRILHIKIMSLIVSSCQRLWLFPFLAFWCYSNIYIYQSIWLEMGLLFLPVIVITFKALNIWFWVRISKPIILFLPLKCCLKQPGGYFLTNMSQRLYVLRMHTHTHLSPFPVGCTVMLALDEVTYHEPYTMWHHICNGTCIAHMDRIRRM